METPVKVITYDLGTTSCKTCLYKIDEKIEYIDSYLGEYPLITLPDGGVEQKVEDWWEAVCTGTKSLLERQQISPDEIKGIAFCSQLQGTVLVDKDGNPLHNPMIWLDSRSTKQIDKILHRGLQIEGYNASVLLKSLRITGGTAGTAKDPVFKYLWLKDNCPEIFKQAYKWCDVKDVLTAKCTGNIVQTYDSAHLTWVYDSRPGHLGWSKSLCKTFGVDMKHLPKVISSTEIVGGLTANAANEMGLQEGIPVFGGGGDASLIPIGAGCTELFDTHIYVGTSGWVVSLVKERSVDIGNFIGAILGAIPGWYNLVAELETSGVCLQWVRDHLALDEIGLYLQAKHAVELDDKYASLYDYMNEVVEQTAPGADGVIFTPWMHGNRSPREDPYVRGMFFNIGLDTGKRQLIRSVLEGVAMHNRWMLEAMEKTIPHRDTLRFVGGGAKSDVWCQIMADITGRKIEVTDNPQNAGTIGAAIVCAVGLGIYKTFQETKQLIPVKKVFEPRKEFKATYDRLFAVFTQLYANNKVAYKQLNSIPSNKGK